jgi:signal transduction histidine kinase
MEDLMDHQPPGGAQTAGQALVQRQVVIRAPRIDTYAFTARVRGGGLLNSGYWELRIARKGGPIDSAVAGWRRRNVLASASVEVLLLAAIGFLLVSTRRMQKLADQKMQFVAGVSHELRTPLSAIAVLSRNQADGLITGADRIQQYGELIHQESRRLQEMVEQTLQYAGIESGRRKPSLAEVNVAQVIETVVAARRGELEQAGFEIEVIVEPDLPPVRGDSPWLEKAVDNLLSNAEKYAGDRRWVRVSALHSPERREVTVTVEDHGIGIDAADFDQIFEPFCRGRRAVEAQIPGSGIGLSLVRSTVEAHRGSVTFASEPDRGSTFTLHLPVAAISE